MSNVKQKEKHAVAPTVLAGATLLLIIALIGSAGAQNTQPKPSPIDAIAAEVAAELASPAVASAAVGIEVIDLATGKTIYSHNPDRKLVPASNMKIVTAAAAIDFLKPDYSFKTEVWVESLKGGVVEGNIYLKGYGDPMLVDEYMWTIARDTAYRGVTEIKGDVFADDSYFDDERHGKGWGDLGPDPYNAPIGALSLNFNTFVVSAVPGPKVGAPPKVFLMPPNRHLAVTNRAQTVAAGRGFLKVVEIPDKVNTYEVFGSIPLGDPYEEYRRTVNDPGLYAAGSFEAYLMSWGIVTSGKIGRKPVPSGARLLVTYKSPPLSRAIWSMGKVSNNFVSEQILKTMGAEATPAGQPKIGTSAGGIEVVKKYLTTLGVNPEAYVLADGSGLSRLNRLTARIIAVVLKNIWSRPDYRPEFVSSLGVGGVDGTIEDRFQSGSLKRRVRAKTGHLTGVNALSGYLETNTGKTLAFSIVFNGFDGSHSSVERVEERILSAFLKY